MTNTTTPTPQANEQTDLSQRFGSDKASEGPPHDTQAPDAGAGDSTPVSFAFDHVAQQVEDIAQAVAWYTALLPDAQVLYQDASWAFVEAGGVRLAFVRQDEHPNHLAWRVSAQDLQQLAARYNRPIATHRDGTRSFYLLGPAGTGVEIITFDGSDWEKSHAQPAAKA